MIYKRVDYLKAQDFGTIAYEIIKRLEQAGETDTLSILSGAVTERERKKGQLHKVFTDSFDATGIYNEKFF